MYEMLSSSERFKTSEKRRLPSITVEVNSERSLGKLG